MNLRDQLKKAFDESGFDPGDYFDPSDGDGEKVIVTVTSLTVGVLLWNTVRDYLNKMKFYGLDIEWIESSGFVEREFVIRGPKEQMDIVNKDLQEWVRQLKGKKR